MEIALIPSLKSWMKPGHEGKYRRIEVMTGRRQRRNWTDEENARNLAERAEPDVNISAVIG
ncbi:hypothetical protein NXT3_PB00078 (plasmid) [Sinorhizobium fredii]|uniref:Uncharacterized protein n=1 Tax=Rhizobium fredii TaxID=380 RepID=A0A2L0HB65_RHIFR|nr:hypothetical protein NXT3_PB00078 [Sinorhizobium fredii]